MLSRMPTRRDLVLSLPALAMVGEAMASFSQTSTAAKDELSHSKSFAIRSLAISDSPSGSFQHVATGKLATGEQIEIHNTTLNPGAMPHPAHRHAHTEFMVIREGSLSWILGEESFTAGPGDILYARSMELHGLKNIGPTVARYAVIAIGNDAGK
jgi:mannose-6-phosphate isomerase-like protein (cupin superfamily)